MNTVHVRHLLPMAICVLVVACGVESPSEGVADPLRPATGSVVVTIRQHFTGELGVGITVTLRRSGADTRAAVTDAAGVATFVGVAVGEWELSFVPPSGFVPWTTRPSPVTVAVSEGQPVRHVFEYVGATNVHPRGDIQVEVRQVTVDGLSARVPGTRIHVEGEGETLEVTLVRDWGNEVLEGLVVGQHVVTVTPPPGFALASGESGEREVRVVQTHLTRVDPFDLERTSGTGGLLGWIGRGPLGEGFIAGEGTTIKLVLDGTEVGSGVAGPRGFYWIDDVEPGEYLLEFELPPGWSVQSGAEPPSDVEVVENRLRYLNVYVLEPPS